MFDGGLQNVLLKHLFLFVTLREKTEMFLNTRWLLIERCSVYSLLAEIKAVREMVIIKADLNVDARASL